MSKDYSYSKWYRTGDLRVVPGFMGFLRAEEQWRVDMYNNHTGLCAMFRTEWRSVGKLPPEVQNNFYAYLQPYDNESPFNRKWRMFIQWLPGMGIKDPVPQSPAENARWHRNLKREKDREQEERDKRPADDD